MDRTIHISWNVDIIIIMDRTINLFWIAIYGPYGPQMLLSPKNEISDVQLSSKSDVWVTYLRQSLQKYSHIINKIQFSDDPDINTKFVQAVADAINTGVFIQALGRDVNTPPQSLYGWLPHGLDTSSYSNLYGS